MLAQWYFNVTLIGAYHQQTFACIDSNACTVILRPYLHVGSQTKVVALLARVLTPDVGGNRAEEAHQQLHTNDQANLKVQKAIIGACRQQKTSIASRSCNNEVDLKVRKQS